MPRRYRFRQVDVFTDRPLHGNPLAVFPGAVGLTVAEMQALAREMNLSETTFVLPPTEEGMARGADYRLRIFTPGLELPFAGHPSIGSAWVLAEEGRFPLDAPQVTVRQELVIGVLALSIEVEPASSGEPDRAGRRIGQVTMTQGTAEVLRRLDADEIVELCEALGVAVSAVGWRHDDGALTRAIPAVVSTGLPHLVVPFADRKAMLGIAEARRSQVATCAHALGCDSAALVARGNSGVIADADVSVRVFDADAFGIASDPATGSAAGPIGVYLGGLAEVRDGTHRLILEQGVEIGRPSRLVVEVDFIINGDAVAVRVSGAVAPIIEGWVTLPDLPAERADGHPAALADGDPAAPAETAPPTANHR